LPVVDDISADYADDVAFVAVAWKGTFDDTAERANQLLTSGNVVWGLDADESIFQSYGVPYQPVTALISADKKVVQMWSGLQEEDVIRERLDALVAG
jgi:hypothetical protein